MVRATLAQGRRGAVLRIAARDGRSGVAGFQVRRPGARPGPWRAWRPSARVRVSAGVVLVRVRDRAGNVSPWRVTRP